MNTTLSRKNKVGLVLALLLALADLVSLANVGQKYDEGTQGPPAGVLIFGAVLGAITVVAAVIAWRSGVRVALRTVAGTRILSMLLAVPAFFVKGVPSGVVALVAVAVVATLVSVALVVSKPHEVAVGAGAGLGVNAP